jgi:hypothetical protein
MRRRASPLEIRSPVASTSASEVPPSVWGSASAASRLMI